MRLLTVCFLVALAMLPGMTQEEGDESPLKPPDEEFRLATLLADQGKYEDAIRHFKKVLKHFEEEDPTTGEERFLVAVARLHVAGFELKQGIDDDQFRGVDTKKCADWLEALFPTDARAASKLAQATGKIGQARNSIDIRKLVRDKSYSGAVVGPNLTRVAAQQLHKWVDSGHRVWVRDEAATHFRFVVAPLVLSQGVTATVRRDRKVKDHPLLANVVDLSFAGQRAGWCVTAHPTAKPLLTVSLRMPRGQPGPRTDPAVCVVAKVGKGEIIFCNGELDTQRGDGAALYRNLQTYLSAFPGAEDPPAK